ncbi:MAG: hypothetical protein IMZ44_16970 [Planctomycetes bacterium]|nr:hypothetical protein [Planctomycetota bacterium]
MASQNHRVEKVEAVLFANLTPVGRVCEVLKAAAAGNKDLSYRIAERCPRKAYSMPDDAYVSRLDDAEVACKAAAATFDKYAFACQQIEELKGFLTEKIAGFIASRGSDLAVDAMFSAGDVQPDWSKVNEAEEKVRAVASTILARTLDAWRGGLHERVRAEWAGFDAFCRSEFQLDAETLLKGFGELPPEFTAWVQGVLSEPPPERQSKGRDKDTADLIAEIEATWRTAFLARQGKNASVT